MKASSKHNGDSADGYQRWQFATLSTESDDPAGDVRTEPMITAAELAHLKDTARKDGYNAGFGSGRADGSTAAAAEAAHLRELAAALDRARVALTDETAQALLTLAVDIAQHILRVELSLHPQSMLPAVREALDLAGGGAHPQLLLNPGDVDFVRRHLGDDLAVHAWRLTEDARIEPGGCRVVSADGAVDATLATRWRRASAALGVPMPADGAGSREPPPAIRAPEPPESDRAAVDATAVDAIAAASAE